MKTPGEHQRVRIIARFLIQVPIQYEASEERAARDRIRAVISDDRPRATSAFAGITADLNAGFLEHGAEAVSGQDRRPSKADKAQFERGHFSLPS